MAEPCHSLLVSLLPLALDPVIPAPLLLVLGGSQEAAVESGKMQIPMQGVKSQVLILCRGPLWTHRLKKPLFNPMLLRP